MLHTSVLAVSVVIFGNAALAQATDRPGWFGQRPVVGPVAGPVAGPPAGYGARDLIQRVNPEGADREAARLYAAAQADIDAARNTQAQRNLELLVAHHPSSPLADVARRDLQRLYASMGQLPLEAVPDRAPPTVAPVAMPTRSLPLAATGPSPDRMVAPVFPRATVVTPVFSVRQATEDFRQQAGDRVFFADGAADIGGRARQALDAQANWLRRYPAILITVEGHADDQGGVELNRKIAEQRAQVVKLRLNDLGVAADRITIVAFGADEPVAKCREQTCSAQNRRVITLVTHVPTGIGFDPPQPTGTAAGWTGKGQAPVPFAPQSSAAAGTQPAQPQPQPPR